MLTVQMVHIKFGDRYTIHQTAAWLYIYGIQSCGWQTAKFCCTCVAIVVLCHCNMYYANRSEKKCSTSGKNLYIQPDVMVNNLWLYSTGMISSHICYG